MILHYEQHPNGRRCYVAHRRLHHGPAGLLICLVGLATRRRWLAVGGALIAAHDLEDFPWRDRDSRHGVVKHWLQIQLKGRNQP